MKAGRQDSRLPISEVKVTQTQKRSSMALAYKGS